MKNTGTMALGREEGPPLCSRCRVAARPWSRMRGLLGRAGLEAGEGLLIRPTSSVHTFAMRFPIDVVFLDGDLRVLKLASLRPWRAASCRRARMALELELGAAAAYGLEPGQRLRLL